jgi:hypothetical protein
MHLGRITVLPSKYENKLVDYCKAMEQRHCGVRRQDIKFMAFQLAIIIVFKLPFDQEKSAAVKK